MMESAAEAFRLAHSGEIREALIMIEGEDGGFELLAHGWLDEGAGEGTPFALVRSCTSNAVHLLGESGEHDPRHPCRWHPIGDVAPLASRHLLDVANLGYDKK